VEGTGAPDPTVLLLHATRNHNMNWARLHLSSSAKMERARKNITMATLIEANPWKEHTVMVMVMGR